MTTMTIRPIIGLEIHVQLATRTKLLCGCPVEFAAEPNSRVCPVCLGLPGALPVMNRAAFEQALKGALALNGHIAAFTKWDRKSYYYPDMPKNYQISQYDLPLSSEGWFEIPTRDGGTKAVRLIRAHLEEDAGKNLHEGLDHTRVDLNRAGTPLLEIVTRPDLSDADEAATFCIELQRLVQFLGISEASMQKGHMRFEPNVNVAITAAGHEVRTPISEIKNLNSFRAVRAAIQYEIDRQIQAWQAAPEYTLEKVGKLNFGWDDQREATEFQRGKEESHDYRYFPDPDLVPVRVDEAWLSRLRAEIGELPLARRRRFRGQYGLTEKECEIVLADQATGELYEQARFAGAEPGVLTRHFVGIWNRLASAAETTVGGLSLPAAIVAELAVLTANGTLSATSAAQVAERLCRERATDKNRPVEIARELGLIQERDEGAMAAWVEEAIRANPAAVEEVHRRGPKHDKSLGFLRGQVMKLSQGKADPRLAGELLARRIAELRDEQP